VCAWVGPGHLRGALKRYIRMGCRCAYAEWPQGIFPRVAGLVGREEGQVLNLPLPVVSTNVVYSLDTGGSMPRLVCGLR
jgi:hypothetical protein